MDEPTPHKPFDALTKREREVAELLALGWSNGQVSARLECAIKTVSTHRAAVLQKLSVRNNVELARLAIREGVVPTP
jgi:DNA-binding NarL/FixJ family response regulator